MPVSLNLVLFRFMKLACFLEEGDGLGTLTLLEGPSCFYQSVGTNLNRFIHLLSSLNVSDKDKVPE
jgi:hypothetical protein